MGIDLTALAVFGGALGAGLGFGLQQIASNFISGLIILLDRSITIGDYIELEDSRAGTLGELTMRSATLETCDGKDIMVPNERFITSAFVNWTHNNKKQRCPFHFVVAYDTNLERLFQIVRETVASHRRVLSDDDLPIAERPDAEIESFGEPGINILVEFWMDGTDDGDNRVGADLLLMIWMALKANGIVIPFPQREVKLSGEVRLPTGSSSWGVYSGLRLALTATTSPAWPCLQRRWPRQADDSDRSGWRRAGDCYSNSQTATAQATMLKTTTISNVRRRGHRVVLVVRPSD